MSRLCGATIKDLKDTIERLRGVYPFEDDKTEIIDTLDYPTASHRLLQVSTYEPEKGVYITLQTDILHDGKKVFEE